MPHVYTRYASLQGKTVIVTGGASGIGADLVEAFCQQGSHVHFLDIDQEAGAALTAQQPARFYPCDLRDIATLRHTIQLIAVQEGGIDVLINNAANDERHDFFSVEPDYWQQRMALNLDHQLFASQAAAAVMREQQSGVILLTSSTSVMKGRPGMVGYTTAKAAILGLNQTLARELGEYGIRVNCVVPGAINTPRQQALWRSPQANEEIARMQAINIDLQGRDVAAMALFVASDDARGCTAAQFIVDAGIRFN